MALTPRQFQYLRRRHRYELEHSELIGGIVASAVANFGFQRLKKPLSAADFMPRRKPEKPLTPEQVVDKIRAQLRPACIDIARG